VYSTDAHVTQSMRRVHHPACLTIMSERGTVPVVPTAPATAEGVEVVAVGGSVCDDGGVLCVAALVFCCVA
jgi:hypothetical protein